VLDRASLSDTRLVFQDEKAVDQFVAEHHQYPSFVRYLEAVRRHPNTRLYTVAELLERENQCTCIRPAMKRKTKRALYGTTGTLNSEWAGILSARVAHQAAGCLLSIGARLFDYRIADETQWFQFERLVHRIGSIQSFTGHPTEIHWTEPATSRAGVFYGASAVEQIRVLNSRKSGTVIAEVDLPTISGPARERPRLAMNPPFDVIAAAQPV